MNKKYQDIIKAFASEVESILYALMDDDRVANNRYPVKELRDKYRKDEIVVKASANGSGNTAVIEILYGNLLEWDRKPQAGNMPPISEIKEWAQQKGLKTDNKTIGLICRSLWMYGHSVKPLIDILEKEIDQLFENEWADKLYDLIADELDGLFD